MSFTWNVLRNSHGVVGIRWFTMWSTRSIGRLVLSHMIFGCGHPRCEWWSHLQGSCSSFFQCFRRFIRPQLPTVPLCGRSWWLARMPPKRADRNFSHFVHMKRCVVVIPMSKQILCLPWAQLPFRSSYCLFQIALLSLEGWLPAIFINP